MKLAGSQFNKLKLWITNGIEVIGDSNGVTNLLDNLTSTRFKALQISYDNSSANIKLMKSQVLNRYN